MTGRLVLRPDRTINKFDVRDSREFAENPYTAPANTTPCTVATTGTTAGSVVSLDAAGTWTGYPTPALTYQWLVDDVAVGGETDPEGFDTTGLSPGDVVTLRETATSLGGTTAEPSSNSVTITA